MTTASAAARLAQVLEQENAALAALDLPGAVALLADKQDAARTFSATPQPIPADSPTAAHLRELAEANRRLLERAIAVQGQVIGLIAAALPQQTGPSGYAASGATVRRGPLIAFALLARA